MCLPLSKALTIKPAGQRPLTIDHASSCPVSRCYTLLYIGSCCFNVWVFSSVVVCAAWGGDAGGALFFTRRVLGWCSMQGLLCPAYDEHSPVLFPTLFLTPFVIVSHS